MAVVATRGGMHGRPPQCSFAILTVAPTGPRQPYVLRESQKILFQAVKISHLRVDRCSPPSERCIIRVLLKGALEPPWIEAGSLDAYVDLLWSRCVADGSSACLRQFARASILKTGAWSNGQPISAGEYLGRFN